MAKGSAADIGSMLDAITGGNDTSATVTTFLDTGCPELNHALSARYDGGVAVGRIMEISGPPSSGKTAIATAVMAHAQKMGGIAAFMDHERSFSIALAPRLGLDISNSKFIYKKPMTFEESLMLCVCVATAIRAGKLIPPDAPICWVFDSLAQMVPKSVFYDQKTGKVRENDRNMNDNTALARATSAHMPAFAIHVENLGIAAIFLNQIRNKIGVVYGDPRTTPGGDASKFAFSQRIMLSAAKIVKDKVVLGTEITAQVIKNKVARPFMSAQWRFVFQEDGTGKFDTYRSMVDFLLRLKRFEVSGNYIVWDGVKLYPEALARRLEAAGEWQKLLDLLPADYAPAMSAEALSLGATADAPLDEVAELGEAA